MINENKLITPIILGGDLGAYSMARAFGETAGVISYVFARDRLAICNSSAFINLTVIKNLDDPNVAVGVLTEFAKEHKEEALILVPTSDWYMEVLQYSREVLSKYYFFYVPDFELWRATTDKARFYQLLEANGIEYPRTVAISADKLSHIKELTSCMKPPFVLKPSDSSMYWRNHFDGMKKVYFPFDITEAVSVAKEIFSSGYDGKIIIQERITSRNEMDELSDPRSSVLTTYSNSNGRVVRAVLGDVLLEEKGATARGNYSAILTRKLDDFSRKLIGMLDSLGYKGIANFDILSSGDKKYCLELNARSGRSSDYVRAAGVNLASMLIKDASGIITEKRMESNRVLWSAAPIRCLDIEGLDYELLLEAQSVFIKNGYSSPFDSYLDKGILRRMYLIVHERRQIRLFERQGREALRCSSKSF